MANNRVRFYPRGDWGYGVGMDKIETIQIPDYKDITINDAIEYYQIKHYFDDGARGKSWTDAEYQEYKEKSKALYGLCMRFFNALNDQIIVDQHETLDILYVLKQKHPTNAKNVLLYPTQKGKELSYAHKAYDMADVTMTMQELMKTCTAKEIDSFFKVIACYNRLLNDE